jgi:hypothetical protein
MYQQYTRKMLRIWYSKKDEIRFKLDNPKANREYPEMEEELAQYITGLRARGVCVSSFLIKVVNIWAKLASTIRNRV